MSDNINFNNQGENSPLPPPQNSQHEQLNQEPFINESDDNQSKSIGIEMNNINGDKPNEPKTWKSSIKSQIIPTSGDVNAVFSVFLDNLANFSLMTGILIYGYGMPSDLVTQYFIPGPAFAIMIGSLLLSAYAIYLDFYETNPNILYTAIPLGLDTPTTIGLPLLVCGPAFKAALANGLSTGDATREAWLVGCATVFLIGALKALLTIISFLQKQFHPVGKAGALAGIALSLLGLNEILAVFEDPVVGWCTLWLLLILLMHRHDKSGKLFGITLPFNISGVLVSAVVGAAMFYFMDGVGISVTTIPDDVASNYYASYPHPSNIFKAFADAIKQNISIVIPYAILVNIGSITVTDGANNVGNKYKFKWVLLIDAFSTVIGSFFGSATQTTPYIGHTVFHNKFKARSGYSIITGLAIGLGGFFGYLGLLTNILPKPAILPIFIFIAFEICSETFHNTKGIKNYHAPAIIWSFFPALFQFANIIIGQISPVLNMAVVDSKLVETTFSISKSFVSKIGIIMILAHGFILTSLLWGSVLGFMLDNKFKKASYFLLVCAFLTFFGIIHSVDPNGEVYVPWNSGSNIAYHWTVSYIIIAAITFGLSFYKTTEIDPNDFHCSTDEGEEIEKPKLTFKEKLKKMKHDFKNHFIIKFISRVILGRR